MAGLGGRDLTVQMGQRETRKARLSDSRLLDIFMRSRKLNLAQGCSVVEANERAHAAVEAGMKPVISVPVIVEL
jgi:hypothetical protein